MAKKAALYLRVSTVYQVDKDSLPMQRKELVAYAEMVLGIEDYEVFEDAGFSGKNTARPAYQEMMMRTRQGEFSHILVWKIDRISRNLLDFAEMYAELKNLRVAFVSKNERFDTSTPMGEAMLKIILVFAELERNMTSMRVSAVMKDRAKQGQWNGANIPYGYIWDAEKKYPLPNEEEALVIRRIFETYLKEKALNKVVKMLVSIGAKTKRGGKWDTATVRQMIMNPFYKGTLRYNYKEAARGKVKPENEWIVIENNHEPMVDAAVWDKCQELLTANTNFKHSPGKTTRQQEGHIFGGLMKCYLCGSPLRSHIMLRKSGIYPSYYECYRRYKYAQPCLARGVINDEQLLPMLLGYVLRILEARRRALEFKSADELQNFLLDGPGFEEVCAIEEVEDLYTSLCRQYASQHLSSQSSVEPSISTVPIATEKARKERALKRLQEAYLYSDDSMTVEEYMDAKRKLKAEIDFLDKQLSDMDRSSSEATGEDFFSLASQYILLKKITAQAKDFTFSELYPFIGREQLRHFFREIISEMYVENGKLRSVSFKGGLTHTFLY